MKDEELVEKFMLHVPTTVLGSGFTSEIIKAVQKEVDSLRTQLAKANERVKELEGYADAFLQLKGEEVVCGRCGQSELCKDFDIFNGGTVGGLLNKFAIEQKQAAINSIKDKWIKKASDMPIGLECRSKGSSCYNWAMYYAKELTDEAQQLRKEKE